MGEREGQAVVLGASIAGPLAARALPDPLSFVEPPPRVGGPLADNVLDKCVDRRIKRADNRRMAGRGIALKLLVVALSVLLVGACSAESGNGGGTGNGGGPAQSQTPPPTALPVQEYATALADALDPLDSALKSLARAKAYKGLNDRVASVETATDQAVTELSPITPPAKLAAEHSQLVTALQAFHGELGDLGSQVGDRALCTGSAVQAGLGDADGTSALRDGLAAVSAKLPKPRPTLTLPALDHKVGSRPPNGKLIRAGNRDGQSALEIDNGGSNDAVVTLSKGSKPAISVYVRKNKTTTVENVPNGSYKVFFTFGAAWDASARAFGRNCAFQRFRPSGKDQLKFQNQGWVITLQRVAGGNSPTDDVDPNDFPDS